MPAVCILQVLPNPLLDIRDFWEGVTRRLLASVELGEADAKADLVNIGIRNQVVGRGRDRWVDEKL